MAKKVLMYNRLDGGISDYSKDGRIPNSYDFGRSIDFRSDPRKFKLLPKPVKESGSVITDLVKFGDRYSTDTYLYGDSGNLYKRDSQGSYTLLKSVSDSSGNGLGYFGEDGYMYYSRDSLIGRFRPSDDSPTFTDDFLGSEGGVPLNTNSIDIELGSSEYATAADSSSLSITSDLTLQGYFKFESLPSVGSQMTLIGKWDETTANDDRSYRMDINAVSGVFGDGSDGSLTISSNTTDAPTDSSCSGTSGSKSLTATNASFAAGQKVLIIQMQGSGAGTFQVNEIDSYTTGTITLVDELNATYSNTSTDEAQVIVIPQYTNVTVDAGFTWTAKAWDGTVGGILVFLANGTVTINGEVTGVGKGFRGGLAGRDAGNNNFGQQGENTTGGQSRTDSAAGNGGGGGGIEATNGLGHGGGGGGNGSAGADGEVGGSGINTDVGIGGGTSGAADLTTMTLGGGGGGGGFGDNNPGAGYGDGGRGGGLLYFQAAAITGTGTISNGGSDGEGGSGDQASGGGGAGGSILFRSQTATFTNLTITASGGAGGTSGTDGGDGGDGRIHLDYLTSYTGSTTPTLNVAQDDSLVSTTTYQLRLSVSDDGAAEDVMAKEIELSTDTWYHLAVSWDASLSTTTFIVDGVSKGTDTGTMTSIDDNSSLLYLFAHEGTGGAAENFYDGKADDIRIYNVARSATAINGNKDVEVGTSEVGLVAYYEFDGDLSDSAGSNNLTHSATATYSTDVPFSSPTTRLDIDQTFSGSTNNYALASSISEGATHRQSFVPTKDPQKSISVDINAKGTGDWTLTVHDPLNREVASLTVVNADLPSSGVYEFEFSEFWRPILGVTYHFHITSSDASGSVVSDTTNDLEDATFVTYYNFLVEDTDYHTITTFLNFISIANGRYVATWDGSTYNPARLTLPPEWRARCFAKYKNYLAIGCWKGTDISDYDEGVIFFWDGISETYNFFIQVPEGAINSMFFSRGDLHIIAGYLGDHLVYRGGDTAVKIKQLPKNDISTYMEVLPQGMAMWQALLRISMGANSNSSSIERGIYTYGTRNVRYPDSLSYDYPISTGNRTASNIETGLVMSIGEKLLYSWKDNMSYGVDVIDPTGDCALTGTVEFLIDDDGSVWKEKLSTVMRAEFEPLTSGQTVRIKYKVDREDNWQTLTSTTTAGATTLRENLSIDRHREIQLAIDLESTSGVSPEILEVSMGEDDLRSEHTI